MTGAYSSAICRPAHIASLSPRLPSKAAFRRAWRWSEHGAPSRCHAAGVAVMESVTVGAMAVALQTDRADINNQIGSTQIHGPATDQLARPQFSGAVKVLPGFTPPVEAHSDAGNPQRSMVTQVERHAAIEQQHQARRRHHQLSVAAAPGGVCAAGRSGGNRQHRQQQLRRRAGNGRRRGHERGHQVRHQRVSRRGLGVSHQQRTEGPQLFLLPLLLLAAIPTVRRRTSTISSAARSADRSKRTSCSSSPTGSEPRAARRPRHSAPFRPPRCAGGDFTGTGGTIYDPNTGNADGTGPHAIPEQHHSHLAHRSRVRLHGEPDSAAEPDRLPEQLPGRRHLSVHPRQHRHEDQLHPHRQACRFSAATASLPPISSIRRRSGAAGGDATNGGQPGTATGLHAERGDRRHLYRLRPRHCLGCRCRLYAPAARRAERRYRQELRPRRAAHSREPTDSIRCRAAIPDSRSRRRVFQPGKSERLQSVSVPRPQYVTSRQCEL